MIQQPGRGMRERRRGLACPPLFLAIYKLLTKRQFADAVYKSNRTARGMST